MRDKRCSLCEGRIVDGRCQECGMTYRQIQGRYYMNENRPAGEQNSEPETAAHKKSKETKGNSDKIAQRIGIIIAAAAIAVSLVGKWKPKEKEYAEKEVAVPVEVIPDTQSPENIYAAVSRELSPEGDFFETKLGAGRYTVGQQIPEGTYRVTGGDWLVFYVDDRKNSIFNNWWTSEYRDENGEVLIEDVRLYQGAVLEITGAGELDFYAENARTDDMEEAMDNPLTQEIQLSQDVLEAGTDFDPGMYDLEMLEGSGNILVEGVDGTTVWIILDAQNEYTEKLYRNVLLEDGMKIEIEENGDGNEEENCTAVMKPSAQIYSRP